MNEHSNKHLQRQLSPTHVWAIAFGCIIGWGSFVNPGKKFLPNSGVAGTAIAMALGAVVMIIIAFSYAYMIPKYPFVGNILLSLILIKLIGFDGIVIGTVSVSLISLVIIVIRFHQKIGYSDNVSYIQKSL